MVSIFVEHGFAIVAGVFFIIWPIWLDVDNYRKSERISFIQLVLSAIIIAFGIMIIYGVNQEIACHTAVIQNHPF